jgi:hypothetical protein
MSNLKASINKSLEDYCCCRRSAEENERPNLCAHGYFNPI